MFHRSFNLTLFLFLVSTSWILISGDGMSNNVQLLSTDDASEGSIAGQKSDDVVILESGQTEVVPQYNEMALEYGDSEYAEQYVLTS